ncbi:hypothetical protein P7C71_g5203, partial [Lecanoromycetidae sp. Uapishka_2]
MKVLSKFLWASSALEIYTVSAQALLYISDAVPLSSKAGPPSISPNTARLLFAQRLGLSQYHSLEDADESTLHILNTYGGKQQQVFGQGKEAQDLERVLVIVDGVSKPDDIFDRSIAPAVTITPQPSSSQNLQLALDLLDQDQYSKLREDYPCSIQFPSSSHFRGGLSSSGVKKEECAARTRLLTEDVNAGSQHSQILTYKTICDSLSFGGHHGQTTVLHVSSLQGLTFKDGARYSTALSELKQLISHFYSASSQISSTIVLMPSTSAPTKRSSSSPYGTYTNPRRQEPEEPLVSSGSAPSTHQPSAAEIDPLQASTSPLPHGIIPACHPTLESAISATNNCSGHGTAYKRSGGDKACYACRCSKTVLTDSEGKTKTVYWGGPACQKKDISIPFFLLAGISIGLVAAATWGVGLLMSIGNEELPSVIGAGVAGPRAQK